MNPSFNHETIQAQYPNMYNNYMGKPNRSDIDADSALNFNNQKNT